MATLVIPFSMMTSKAKKVKPAIFWNKTGHLEQNRALRALEAEPGTYTITISAIPFTVMTNRAKKVKAIIFWSRTGQSGHLKQNRALGAGQGSYRHGHLSNPIHHDDQQGKESEASNLLAIIGADRVHMGPKEKRCST